jgi:biotin carboxylase
MGGTAQKQANKHNDGTSWPPGQPSSREAVAVVDPYSSGRYLLYELKKRYVPIVCVRSSLKLGPFFLASYETHKDYFVHTIDHEGDLSSTLAKLTACPYTIKAVVPGCEPGVELADALSEGMGVQSNGTELTWARRDKGGMQERLAQCGVPSAEQVKSADINVLLPWAREREARLGKEVAYPVVVKPTGGSGGEGVYFCDSEHDLVQAHSELIGTTQTGSGQQVESLALQEFLAGTEYIIDTCTLEGEHLCCAVWRYNKRKGTPWNPHCILTQYQEILLAQGEEQEALVKYVFAVLDAVGLRHGPCHTEVMLTKRGPILVEVNARMHGVQGPHMIEKATGTGLASYFADAIMKGWRGDGGLLREHIAVGKSAGHGRWMYPRRACCAIVMLVSHAEGFLLEETDKQVGNIQLPSLLEVCPSVKKGALLQQSIDLNTMAGYALLLHPSEEQMLQDIAAIRAAEEAGLYPVSQDAAWSRKASPVWSRKNSPVFSASQGLSRQASPSMEKADELWAESNQSSMNEVGESMHVEVMMLPDSELFVGA